VTKEICGRLVQLVGQLPEQDVSRIAAALQGGGGLKRLRSQAGSPALRSACDEARQAAADTSASFVAGVLLGALATRQRRQHRTDAVWSGPSSGVKTSRLTSAAVIDLVDQANSEILLMSYVMHDEPGLAAALERGAERGAEITLVHERPTDNPSFQGPGTAFTQVTARRLRWPADRRPAAASLHAKVLVVDRKVALVGSANVTSSAVARNLECGVLLRDAVVAKDIALHVDDLVRLGELVPVADPG
jgi:cardiolipin synthase